MLVVALFNNKIVSQYGYVDDSDEQSPEDAACNVQVGSFEEISTHSCYQRLKDDTSFNETMDNLSDRGVLNEGVSLP